MRKREALNLSFHFITKRGPPLLGPPWHSIILITRIRKDYKKRPSSSLFLREELLINC